MEQHVLLHQTFFFVYDSGQVRVFVSLFQPSLIFVTGPEPTKVEHLSKGQALTLPVNFRQGRKELVRCKTH
jgi:hypothetical protein